MIVSYSLDLIGRIWLLCFAGPESAKVDKHLFESSRRFMLDNLIDNLFPEGPGLTTGIVIQNWIVWAIHTDQLRLLL